MPAFKPVSSQVSFPALEEQVLEQWKEQNTFERSVHMRPTDKRFVFYDGPPFATGLPHYGHLVASTLKDIVPQLIEYGRLNRPVLGVELLSDDWAKRFRTKGVALLSVLPRGPAARAGMIGMREDRRGRIHLGDVIIAIDDEPIQNQDELLATLERHRAGDVVRVTTMREEKIEHYDVTLAQAE